MKNVLISWSGGKDICLAPLVEGLICDLVRATSAGSFPSGQKVANSFSESLQTKEREAVVSSLPISMHTGQIILLAKMYAEIDLEFYDFSDSTPVPNWKREP